MRLTAVLVPLVVAGTPSPSVAQDVGGAFDMGQLTGSLSQDHITQSERARAGGGSVQNRQRIVAKTCGKDLPVYRARYGAQHPSVAKLIRMCRGVGY